MIFIVAFRCVNKFSGRVKFIIQAAFLATGFKTGDMLSRTKDKLNYLNGRLFVFERLLYAWSAQENKSSHNLTLEPF